MKIVHVMNWYIPKMGYQENFLPAEQKKLGHDVQIITSDRIPNYKGYHKNIGSVVGNRIIGKGVFEENNVLIHRLSSSIEISNGGLIMLKGLKAKLKELRPDIVQLHGALSLSTIQAIMYSKKLGYFTFVDDHSHKNNFTVDSIPKKLYIQLIRFYYGLYGNRVIAWMPVTDAAKYTIKSLFKISDNKIDLIYLGVDTNRFNKSTELRNIGRKINDIDENTILIISSGKFTKEKDIHILIEAFRKINMEYPRTILLLVGGGPKEYMEKLRSLVHALRLKEKVIFKDFVPNSELPKYYNAADIGIWPGDHTITAIEAVATGLPVIVPENDLAYKVLHDNDAALDFKRGNADSLYKSVINLIESEELCNSITSNSSILIKETLSWEKIAEKSISIYVSKIGSDIFDS